MQKCGTQKPWDKSQKKELNISIDRHLACPTRVGQARDKLRREIVDMECKTLNVGGGNGLVFFI